MIANSADIAVWALVVAVMVVVFWRAVVVLAAVAVVWAILYAVTSASVLMSQVA